ncbi:hypothetical protein ASE69_19460 [Sphingomonas sp. Leaf208]|nr:hypothetical protein ASE69_19460 [Sphingomonas sp. Leaf208]
MEAALSEGRDDADVDKMLMEALFLLEHRQEHLAAALVGQALTWLRWQDEIGLELRPDGKPHASQ